MKKNKIHNSKPNKDYHWIVTPDAYLATALSICTAILPNGFPEQVSKDSSFIKRLGFRSAHANYELIFPIVFNLKHGIELYLKGLGCVDHHTYLTVHDLKELFNFIIENSKDNTIKNIITKLQDETWPIIKKYYYGTYIPTITTETKPDKANNTERYPESNAYKIPDPLSWVTGNVLATIIKDIKFREKKFAQAKRDIINSKKGT